MAKRIDIDIQKIAAANPNVDVKQVEEARRAIRVLRGLGVTEAQYDLVRPFSGKRQARASGSEGSAVQRQRTSYTRA